MHKLFLLLTATIISTLVFSQEQAKRKIRINNVLEMTVPNSFPEPVASQQDAKVLSWTIHETGKSVMLNYHLPKKVNASANPITDNDIPEWTDKRLEELKKMASFKYIDDGIFLQDGKNIGFIKYRIKINGGTGPARYNLLFFTTVQGILFQATFTCPIKLRKKWEPIADEIANSLRIIPAE